MNTLLCLGLILCATLAMTAAFPAVEDVAVAVPPQQGPVEAVPEEGLETGESRQKRWLHGGWGHGGYGGWGHGGYGGWGGRGGWGYGGGYGGGYGLGGWGRGGGYGYGGGYGGGWGYRR